MNRIKKNFQFYCYKFTTFFLYFCFCIFFVSAQSIPQKKKTSLKLDPTLPFKLCAQVQYNKFAPAKIASDNLLIFSALPNNKIEKFNLKENNVVWTSDFGGDLISDLIFENSTIFFMTKILKIESFKEKSRSEDQIENYVLWSINAETGLTDWQFPFTAEASVILDSYRDKLFLITKDGTVSLINKVNSQKILNTKLASEFSSPPSFFENKIYIGAGDKTILIVSIDTGEIVSKIRSLEVPASILIGAKEKLIWGDKKGTVNLVDTRTNKRIWSVRYGGEISSLSLVQAGILVSSLDNFIYLISLQKGKKIWKRRLAGRISAEPLIIENSAVVVTAVNGTVSILDISSGKIINQIILPEASFILTKPVIVGGLILFSTNTGIVAFSNINGSCSKQ